MMKCCAAKRFGQMEVQRPLGGEAPLRFRVPEIDILLALYVDLGCECYRCAIRLISEKTDIRKTDGILGFSRDQHSSEDKPIINSSIPSKII